MSITGVDFDDAWQHRVETEVNGVRVLFISKDDLIASKLAAGRPQDLLDATTLQMPVQPIADVQTRDRSKQDF